MCFVLVLLKDKLISRCLALFKSKAMIYIDLNIYPDSLIQNNISLYAMLYIYIIFIIVFTFQHSMTCK